MISCKSPEPKTVSGYFKSSSGLNGKLGIKAKVCTKQNRDQNGGPHMF